MRQTTSDLWTVHRQPVVGALAFDETSHKWVVTSSPAEGTVCGDTVEVHETLAQVQQGLCRQRGVVSSNPDGPVLAQLWDDKPDTEGEPEYKFNLLGRHFLDSSEQRVYLVSDIFFDVSCQQ